ncbi:MAG: hypothetical protein M1377_05130 [Deltaproteobacteria bacterium]|nr:hypothetical protein [Deltaproteobacteria bacterium]
MTLYAVSLEWNHKGDRYEKRAHERVSASSAGAAAGAALRETRKKHRGSLREIPGARLHIIITVIGREEA